MISVWRLSLSLLGLFGVRHSLCHVLSHPGTLVHYNVFYPRSCTTECSLGVRWEEYNDTNWINFTLMARTRGSEAVWAAVGFSENDRMSNSDVVACWYHNNNYEVYNAWNTDYSHTCVLDDNQDIVQFHGGNYTDGLLTCSFGRMKVLNDTKKKDKSLDTKWHILLAWGHLHEATLGSSKPFTMVQHSLQYSTGCTCDVTNSMELCLCINEFRLLLLKLHGTVMSVVFILLFPTGAFIATFYKNIIVEKWFQSHIVLMITGTLSMIAGLGLVLGHTGGLIVVGPHQIIGCITIGFAMIQVLVAMFRPAKNQSLHRKIFEKFHSVNAKLVLVLGYLSLFLGCWVLFSHTRVQNTIFIWMTASLGVSFTLSMSFFIVMFIMNLIKSCKVKSPPVRYHKVSSDADAEEEVDVNKEENDSSLQYSKQRTLLIGFILQSFTMAGLLSAFVFYSKQ